MVSETKYEMKVYITDGNVNAAIRFKMYPFLAQYTSYSSASSK